MIHKLIRIGTRYEPVHYKRLKAALKRIEKKWGRIVVITHFAQNRYDIGIEKR